MCFKGRYTKILYSNYSWSINYIYLLSEYFRQKKKAKKIISLVDNVSEKYLISALSLALENNNDFRLKQEVDKIKQLLEQMLYYARSENTEKDYFVKEIKVIR